MTTAFLLVFFLGIVFGLSISNLGRLKDFQFFNTWFMFFVSTLLLFIPISTFFLVNGATEMLMALSPRTIKAILVPSFFGGLGLFLVFNAIRKSDSTHSILLFLLSLLIGIATRDFIFLSKTISFLQFGVPIFGIVLWLIVIKEIGFNKVTLPVLGGLAASGFGVVFDVEPQTILSLGQSFDNTFWQVYLFKIAFMSVGACVILLPIFLAQMGQKNAWVFYDTPHFWKNLIFIVGISALVVLCLFGFPYAYEMVENGLEKYLLSLFFTGIILGNVLMMFENQKKFPNQLIVIAIILLGLNLNLFFELV